MAAAIARRIAAERGMGDLEIGSAGTSSWEGAPASDGALLVGIEHQLDLNEHRSRQLTRELVAAQDVILAMGPHHLERVYALGGGDRAHLLTSYASRGAAARAISDPMGSELDVYRTTFEELEREIRRVFDRIESERAPGRS